MPHELFRLSHFGFKNCAKLFRIKFLHQEIKLIFLKRVGVMPRKAAKLEKVIRNLKKSSFDSTGRKTEKWWELTWIYCYLLNGIGLDLELQNANLVQKIPK